MDRGLVRAAEVPTEPVNEPDHKAGSRGSSGVFRRRLVEGRLTTKDTSTVPECFHRILKHLERKKAVGGCLGYSLGHTRPGLLLSEFFSRWFELI